MVARPDDRFGPAPTSWRLVPGGKTSSSPGAVHSTVTEYSVTVPLTLFQHARPLPPVHKLAPSRSMIACVTSGTRAGRKVEAFDCQATRLRRMELCGRFAHLFRPIDALLVPGQPFAPLTLDEFQHPRQSTRSHPEAPEVRGAVRSKRPSHRDAAGRLQRARYANRSAISGT